MMLNKVPENLSHTQILMYLSQNEKWGRRNRALYVLRKRLRIKDIATMTIADILSTNMSIRRTYVSTIDNSTYELDPITRSELQSYLFILLEDEIHPFKDFWQTDLTIPLFPTNKRESFSANTLAQHFSHLDRDIRNYFTHED